MTRGRPICLFRVDASVRIGTGHVHRCLALASALAARGMACHFVHRLHDGHMADVIRQRGYTVHTLPAPARATAIADGDYRAWAGATEADDAVSTSTIATTLGASMLVLDHYGYGREWERHLRGAVQSLMVIDDLANREHDCDLLLDQNYFADGAARYEGLVPAACRRLCGPQYALLAPEYANARPSRHPRQGPVQRVLVFFGGSDLADHTSQTLHVLNEAAFRHLAVDVVVGPGYAAFDALAAAASAHGHVTVHRGLPSLLPLMTAADVAIGAGGISVWERCCVGLPAIVTAIAQNQHAPAQALSAAGACILLPDASDATRHSAAWQAALRETLHALIDHPSRLAELADAAWQMGEGRGTGLAAEMLCPSTHDTMQLRAARPDDCRLYWRWVNDPDVRLASLEQSPVDWAAHRRWFTRRLHADASRLWVFETPDGAPVGQFRVDVVGGHGHVDFSVDRIFRGRGLGTALVRAGSLAWSADHPGIPLTAVVRQTNPASASVFRASGLFDEGTSPSDDMRVGYTFALRTAAAPRPVASCSP